MSDNVKEIRKLEDKYGLVLFRMGLTYLVDVGTRFFSDENIEESFKDIVTKEESNKADGIISVMTPEFQCEIIRCAAELAKFSIWDLFAYIKKHLVISN